MKPEPPSNTARWRVPWHAIVGTLLAIMLPALTVLGAILLSLQGQVQAGRPVARQPEGIQEELIPTAAGATPPAVTLRPVTPTTNAVEPAVTSSPTLRADVEPETPNPTPEIAATMPLLGTTAPAPSATPWPCAGYAPMDWNLYIVVRGDTLFSLARRHSTRLDETILYNCLTSDQLWAGQRLYLPVLPTTEPSATATLTPTPSPTSTPVSPVPPSPTTLPTFTATVTETASPTPNPSPSSTPAFTPSATVPANPTVTATITATVPVQPTISPTLTPTPTGTPDLSPTATANPAVSPSPSLTPTETLTPSPAP